eukprot:256393_1
MPSLDHIGNTFEYLVATIIISCVSMLVIAILTVFEFICFNRLRVSNKKKKSQINGNPKIIHVHICTIIAFLCWAFQAITSFLTSFIYTSYHQPILYLHFFLYYTGMLNKWYVWITRLIIIYRGTPYEYNNSKVCIVVVVIALWQTVLLIVTCVDLESNIIVIHGLYLYEMIVSKIYLILLNITDIVISVVVLTLFVNPMKQMNDNKNDDPAKSRINSKFKRLTFKYFITTIIASLSTTLFMIAVLLVGNGKLIAFDNMLNAICLALMCGWNEKYFDCICCGATFVFGKCFYSLHSKFITQQLGNYVNDTNEKVINNNKTVDV